MAFCWNVFGLLLKVCSLFFFGIKRLIREKKRYSGAFLRCVAQEQTESQFRLVLFDGSPVKEEVLAVEAGALLLQTNGWVECCVSQSGERTEPWLVTLPSPGKRSKVLVSRSGSVCLTGGYGALGQVFSRWSASCNLSVMLMGRSGASANKASVPDTVRAGLFKVDAARLENVSISMSLFEMACGSSIETVLHLSGLAKDALYFNQQDSALKESFASKCGVLKRQWRALSGRRVSWVLFSSISAVMGNQGQSSYSAANAYLDSFAHSHPSVVSVNWGPWGGGGMFAKVASMLVLLFCLFVVVCVLINPSQGILI